MPADGIRQLAVTLGADLIVMGTHGRSGLNRWMLGSVTERKLRESPIQLLTVRTAPRGPVRRIMSPIDGTKASRNAFLLAARMGTCFNTQGTAPYVGCVARIFSAALSFTGVRATRGSRSLHPEDLVDKQDLSNYVFPRQPSHLSFPDHLHGLVALQRSPSTIERSKSLTRIHAPLDGSMILFHDIVQIWAGCGSGTADSVSSPVSVPRSPAGRKCCHLH